MSHPKRRLQYAGTINMLQHFTQAHLRGSPYAEVFRQDTLRVMTRAAAQYGHDNVTPLLKVFAFDAFEERAAGYEVEFVVAGLPMEQALTHIDQGARQFVVFFQQWDNRWVYTFEKDPHGTIVRYLATPFI